MIAKQIKGTGFGGVIAYNEKKVNNGEAELLETNLSGRTKRELTREFNLIKQLRPNLTRAVYHVSLNLPKHEKLSNEDFTAMSLKYLNKMGFKDNQYLIYRHYDSDHAHCHIIANRVEYSGEVVSDSNDYKRSEKIVRQLEIEFGLERLQAVNKRTRSKLTKAEIEKTIRTGEVPIRIIMQQKIDKVILSSETIGQFIQGLLNENIHPKFNISKTTNRVSGVSFMMDSIIFKGSKLGKKYSWNSIIKQISYDQNRDSAIIHKANRVETRIEKEKESKIKDAVEAIGHVNTIEIAKTLPEYYLKQLTGYSQETESDEEQSVKKNKRRKRDQDSYSY